MDIGWPEITIIAIVILVLFGSKKLPDAARSLGRSMRILKTEIKDLHHDDDEKAAADAPVAALPPAATAATPPVATPPAAAPVVPPAVPAEQVSVGDQTSPSA